jgi:hypothetical protein
MMKMIKLLMPRTKKDLDAEAIAALPWVESVTKKALGKAAKTAKVDDDLGYIVKTKPGGLKITVTHGITKGAGGDHYIGKELGEPLQVPMPSLTILVAPRRYGVSVAMGKKPEGTDYPRFLPYPSWDGSGLQHDNWDYPGSPCWGDYYDYPDSYVKRAEFIADYIQHSMPHRSEHRGGSRWALWLGLMPAEHIVENEKIYDDEWIEDIEEMDHDEDDMCDCDDCVAERDDGWDD